ncbi:MAG: NAD(P)H-dependent oxidoreductase [Ferruginibacter sp.]
MKKIIILSSSVRTGRKSNRVALYFQKYINAQHWGETELIDLKELNFPVFEERLKYLKDPSESLLQFAASIKEARGIVIITPEYNGGYPASLKNAIDVLYSEWQLKPIAIVTVSDGAFGGMQAITSLQFILFKMGVWTVPALFPVPNIDKTFTEEGEAIDKEATDKRAEKFLSQFKWFMDR